MKGYKASSVLNGTPGSQSVIKILFLASLLLIRRKIFKY